MKTRKNCAWCNKEFEIPPRPRKQGRSVIYCPKCKESNAERKYNKIRDKCPFCKKLKLITSERCKDCNRRLSKKFMGFGRTRGHTSW